MARFIELTENNAYIERADKSIIVNCDNITYIEPDGLGCWIRFGENYVAVRENYKDVCELIELATNNTIKRA